MAAVPFRPTMASPHSLQQQERAAALRRLAPAIRGTGVVELRFIAERLLVLTESISDSAEVARTLLEEAERPSDLLIDLLPLEDPSPDAGAPAASAEPAPEDTPPHPAAKAKGRKRSRYPAGHEKAGEFIPDDPSTAENEAWEPT